MKKILMQLPEYLNDYSIICTDISENPMDDYLDIPYELSVLASVIRKTAIAIDFIFCERVFGRTSAIVTCNKLLEGKLTIPIEDYLKLYSNRLFITGKSHTHAQMDIADMKCWLSRADKLISYAKEAYYERKNDDIMGGTVKHE